MAQLELMGCVCVCVMIQKSEHQKKHTEILKQPLKFYSWLDLPKENPRAKRQAYILGFAVIVW